MDTTTTTTAARYDVSEITAQLIECLRDCDTLLERIYNLVEADELREVDATKQPQLYEHALTAAGERIRPLSIAFGTVQKEIAAQIRQRVEETLLKEMPADRNAPVSL